MSSFVDVVVADHIATFTLDSPTTRNALSRQARHPPLPLALCALEVPVIAAVNGPAVGAGLDLACLCDIRLAGASARFAESFVRRRRRLPAPADVGSAKAADGRLQTAGLGYPLRILSSNFRAGEC